jgi:uncharacterized Zn finger protein (UPF0148 family)
MPEYLVYVVCPMCDAKEEVSNPFQETDTTGLLHFDRHENDAILKNDWRWGETKDGELVCADCFSFSKATDSKNATSKKRKKLKK